MINSRIYFFIVLFLLSQFSTDPEKHACFGNQRAHYYVRRYINNKLTHAVFFNLNHPQIDIIPVRAYRGESFGHLIHRTTPVAAINGTYFSDYITYHPIGDMMYRKQLLNFGGNGSILGITLNNRIFFKKTLRYRHISWEHQFTTVIGAGPRLVANNRISVFPYAEGFSDPHLFQLKRRSVLGLTHNNYFVMIVIQTPCYLSDAAKIAKALGCKDAMNLDGGSSCALYYNDKLIMPSRINPISNNINVVYQENFWWERWRYFIK